MSTTDEACGALGAAYAATAVWLATGAVLDVALVAKGRRPITHVLRTPAGAAFLIVLGLHVADRLGPLDPFRAAGRVVTRWVEIRETHGPES